MKNIANEELIQSWQAFYRDLFEIEADFSNLQIPANQQGFDRLIIVAQGMDPERLFHKCREFFFGWKSTDDSLDEVVQSDRSSKNGPYAVWFRETVEADEDLKNLSVEDLKAKGIPCITLEERLLYELKYYNETDWHLDPDTFTLCAGSRFTDGYVPTVRYRVTAVGLGIHWYETKDSFDTVRARRAIL
ncbi:hypothetical protein ACFLX3_03645 [Chloroflexota bacterium]